MLVSTKSIGAKALLLLLLCVLFFLVEEVTDVTMQLIQGQGGSSSWSSLNTIVISCSNLLQAPSFPFLLDELGEDQPQGPQDMTKHNGRANIH